MTASTREGHPAIRTPERLPWCGERGQESEVAAPGLCPAGRV